MSGSILSGSVIDGAVQAGQIEIDPYDKAQLNVASYDLRLGPTVRIYFPYDAERAVYHAINPNYAMEQPVLDTKERNPSTLFEIPKAGLVLKPGNLYLMQTAERIHTDYYVSILDGKSSIGRLGVCIHLTAGYGDPGFDGQYTLEVTCVYPIKVYAGMRFCQMRFQTLEGGVEDYKKKGHYTGDLARGPVESMSYKQFEES